MGFFLSSLQNEMATLEQRVKQWAEPLQKIREYHGVFKSVCDTFVIRSDQFPQIFGSNDKLALWQGNATINALQVFCGLGFYSSCSGFRLKLKFLFALFDFNEIKSISVVDLEYMILSILNFTYRILKRTNSRADELRLAEWLMRFVNPHKRININSLARFCHQSQEARNFLRMTNNLEGEVGEIPFEVYDQEQYMEESERLALLEERKQIEINSKLAWFGNFTQKLTKPKYKKEVISTCNLTWVYGIELHRFRVPFLVLSDGRILYAISSKAVIYCANSNSQSIYARHCKQIESFTVYQPNFIVASSEGETSPKIHIWDYRTLETQHIISIDHSHRVHLLSFSPSGVLVAVGARQHSPVVLFDSKNNFSLRTSFAVEDSIVMLVPFFTPLELQSLSVALVNIFVLGGKKSIIVVDQKYNKHISSYESNITSIAVSYMSTEQPFRRYFTGNSLRLFIVTSHQSGAVTITIFDPATYSFDPERYELFKFDEPPKRLILTAESFLVILRYEVRVYDLNIFALHEQKAIDQDHCRSIKVNDNEHLRLLSHQFLFAAINRDLIFLVTIEGDFLQVGDREIQFDGSLHEQESIKRLDEFVRLEGKLRALCFAERQGRGTIMVVSENKKVFEIDPESHKVNLMLEISYNDVITVIDYAISEEGPAYLVCGSQSGRLLVRIDEEEVAKVYDCQCEVTDLKISRDASYLLIATLNSVMFFQLMPSFSSPRKMTFQNQSPVSLNFLDNPRFCSVGTSAKNVYLIEVPQLRHRNVQKDNQSFSATKMAVDFPHRLQATSPKLSYSRCFVGGDMKFYLFTLTTGEMLYFPSMSSLQHKNYLMLRAHQCPIANVVISEDQSLFYTVGESDSMLLEWSVHEQRSQFVGKQPNEVKDKEQAELAEARSLETFSRMRLVSEMSKEKQENTELCTFFFRGTRSEKLNRRLQESLKLNTDNLGDDELALMKRHCRAYLKINTVYGLQSNKYGQVRYLSKNTEDNRILYSTSRFLVETEGQGSHHENIYETATQIAYFSLSELGEPVYAECGSCPRIFVAGVEAVRTLHKNGLMHFTLYGDFVLSFGLEQNCFSINLHNFRTRLLVGERTTYHQVIQFMMLSPNQFISLHQVRMWHGLIASEALGMASSGAVLPGGKDVCLGGMQGQLSVLSANGIFEMASNAHSKQIIAIQVNRQVSSFEIITASLDETVKIWNEYFEPLLTINLTVPGEFKVLREMDSLGISDINPRCQAFVVRSLDCKNHRILLSMTLGQIWEYQISSREQKVHDNQDLNSSDNVSSESNQDLNDDMPLRSQRIQLNFYVERKRLLNAHCSHSVPLLQRFVAFDVHLELPLFVSSGSDGKLTFRDYLREQVLANYVCERDERVKVRAVKFSPRGRMLVVGLTTGVAMTFFMDLSYNALKNISQVQLRHFQTFKIEEASYEILTVEFNQTGDMFAVSYAAFSKRQRSSDPRQSAALIRIYRIKSEKNQNTDEAFYEFRGQQIRLREEESSGKAFRCAVKLQFENQQNKTYLFVAEEFFDSQGIRLFSTRGKYSVYCLEDKGFLSDEYAINWEKCAFPALINLRYHDPKTDETQENYTITAMLRWRDFLIYGGYDGRLHLLRLESLEASEESGECRLQDMCLSRVFSALTSPITQLRVGGYGQHRFLFVGGYGDECVVKMEIIEEDPAYFLQHQSYPLEGQDLMNEYLGKEHFYLTINNRQPLREELSNILEDVESQPSTGLQLQFVKAFGRRAIDRRYNLTYFDQNLLYCLGPNLIVENIKSSSQYLLKADPSPFSHCPQISAFHFNSRFLIVATQEERSNIYVWDIKSKSCIKSMQLECSFVLVIRFLGEHHAVYYGINDKYESVIALVDWRAGCTLGSMRLAFSGLSAVRDLAVISSHERSLGVGKQFVTCGYLHLCWWEMRGDSLVYNNFNSQSEGRYVCVKELNGYIVTGCEEGHLYLWHQQEMIHVLPHQHSAAVRCLEVDIHNQFFISGGKDGVIIFLKVEENRLAPFNRVELNKANSNLSIDEEHSESFKVEFQVQALAPNPSLQDQNYEQLLIGTRSGNIFEIKYNQSTQSTTLLCEHHDNQTVVSATFSAFDRHSFFTLTNAGLIERYSLTTFARTLSFDLGQRALKIEACQELLLVCCRQQVVAYRILGQQSRFQRSESFWIDARKLQDEGKDVEIIRFCLSKTERLLSICVKNCGKEPTYQVAIFNLNGQLLHQLGNLKHEIDYLDFSVDDKYLLFKDRYEEIGMISLDKEYRKINTIFVEMGIEWQQEALRLSPSAQSIYYSYSCENKITALARLGPDKLIVGDQMGTVRIFDYPCPDDKLGELHLHCYCVHMNDIAQIVVHPQLSHVLTIGLQDRSLVLWRVSAQ